MVKVSTADGPANSVNPFTPSVSASVATMFVGSETLIICIPPPAPTMA